MASSFLTTTVLAFAFSGFAIARLSDLIGLVLDAAPGGESIGSSYRGAMLVCLVCTGGALLRSLRITETHARNIAEV